MKWIILDDK